MGGLDLTALGPGGDPSALIAQLEAMADEFERQSGQPEMEIRSQITMLRSVLAARPAAVARTRGQMDAALRVLEQAPLMSKSREPWVVRLRYAYADTLEAAGRPTEALTWFHRTDAIDGDELTDAAERAAALEAQQD